MLWRVVILEQSSSASNNVRRSSHRHSLADAHNKKYLFQKVKSQIEVSSETNDELLQSTSNSLLTFNTAYKEQRQTFSTRNIQSLNEGLDEDYDHETSSTRRSRRSTLLSIIHDERPSTAPAAVTAGHSSEAPSSSSSKLLKTVQSIRRTSVMFHDEESANASNNRLKRLLRRQTVMNDLQDRLKFREKIAAKTIQRGE